MYSPTRLEKRISNLLISHGITSPEDLRKENLAKMFDIELYKSHTSYAYTNGEFKAIMINQGNNEKQQNFEFYHEFGHIILHFGNQLLRKRVFNWYQELDANMFSHYISIPHHMLSYIDFDSENLEEILSDQFLVPLSVIRKRLIMIQENLKNEHLRKIFA